MNRKLELFAQQLQEMQNPRERRGFLDSFYASLVHGGMDYLTKEEIERAASILASNPLFISHARKLRAHPYTKNDGVLPGAELFSEYLSAQVGQDLRVVGPKVLGTSEGAYSTKRYAVLASDQLLGYYYQFGPGPGEEQAQKAFRGLVSGYVNGCVVVYNRHSQLPGDSFPENSVYLVWANERFEHRSSDEYQNLDLQDKVAHLNRRYPRGGDIVATPWQRQDGNKQIPFP